MGKLFKLYQDQTPVKKAGGHVHATIHAGEVEDKICLWIKDDYAERTNAVFEGYRLNLSFSEARKIARVLNEYVASNQTTPPADTGAK